MARIGIAARLTLIVVVALIGLQMFVVANYFFERREAADGATFAPLFGQIAAIVQLLDKEPEIERSLILRATTGPNFILSIRPDIPQNHAPEASMRVAVWRLQRLLGADDGRYVSVSLMKETSSENGPVKLSDYIGRTFHAVIGLKSGGYLDVRATGNLMMRVFGIPVGFLAGVLGVCIAVVALLAVRRETKPLTTLGIAVERFGKSLEPQEVAQKGAPDVRALIGAVNAMQHRIVQLVRSRSIVLGAMSHDLRTYLTRLRLRIELLPESELRDKAVADISGMQDVVDDTLAFARASFAAGPSDIADLTQIARKEYEARKSLGEKITLSGPESPLMVSGSTVALTRVMSNLVSNAINYGHCADIALRADAQSVELEIADRGPGIAESDREQVFEPFYRTEVSRNMDRGSVGLGLAIVRQIVESCQGDVRIKDRDGGGAMICVMLKRRPLAT